MNDTFFEGSRLYDLIAVLRQGAETLIVVWVGVNASKCFMIVTPAGASAWPHKPMASLSDAAWALRPHGWHQAAIEPTGQSPTPAKTLSRLLRERA